ncbi:hypothetical protein LTR17_023705 [Elasticomyces elasticus]|nr:hypothetical protein LTR17_023705 [Elasticomyces elasticus]
MEKNMDIKSSSPTSSPDPEVDISASKENDGIRDVNADLFHEIGEYSHEELEAERVTVRKKLDMIIMPLICVTYCLQFLDKLSLNYAAAYTFIPDLGLEGHRYSWVAAVFNFGYLFWALPANLLIQKLPIGKLTGTTIFIWAILLCAHVGAKNYGGILVLRFLLGMFEAGISPSIMAIVSMFYTRSEQPFRMCIFLGFNGMSTIIGSLLSYGLGHADDAAIKSWQLIFMTIGLMNFVWSIVFLTFMPDSAANARFLTHKQKVIAVDRVSKNMVGVKTKQYKMPQVFEALLDFKVWCLVLIGMATGIINGIMVVCLIPLGGLLGIRLTSLDHRWSLVGSSWLQGIVGAPIILCWNLLSTNIAGHTKRSISNGMWFCFYAAGNIAGANIFDSREAPRYFSALTGMIVCYCATIALAGVLWIYMAWENKRRDKKLGEGEQTVTGAEEQAVLDGFRDRTDKENNGFRYGL